MYTYIHIFLLNHLCLCTGGMERERTTAGTGALADGSADTGAREVRGDGVVWKSLDAHVADVRELARSMRSRSPGQMVTTKRCLCVCVRVSMCVCACVVCLCVTVCEWTLLILSSATSSPTPLILSLRPHV